MIFDDAVNDRKPETGPLLRSLVVKKGSKMWALTWCYAAACVADSHTGVFVRHPLQ